MERGRGVIRGRKIDFCGGFFSTIERGNRACLKRAPTAVAYLVSQIPDSLGYT